MADQILGISREIERRCMLAFRAKRDQLLVQNPSMTPDAAAARAVELLPHIYEQYSTARLDLHLRRIPPLLFSDMDNE